MTDRPFKVLGIQQVAIGALNKEDLKKFWIDILGLSVTGNFRSESENVDEDITAAGEGPL
ncbi:MAG: VOC family protein, partial [Dehalococcoidia bacterium]|nr:VOC family protein [Dehalococcoidia bacterium]